MATYQLTVVNCPSQVGGRRPQWRERLRSSGSSLPHRAPPVFLCLQDLAKTNQVFVSPTDPAALASFLVLGDL